MSNNDTKFDWHATESGPENYPMQVIHGMLYYHNDPEGKGLYVPSGAVVYKGWGVMRSSHVTGPDLKPLPDKLEITYFSYAENTFYQGSFDLPYDKILALFRAGMEENKEDPTYSSIMVGVAPGGSVAVWVMGRGIKEVFFGKAHQIESELRVLGGIISGDERKEYVNEELEDSVKPEILANIRKNGIPFDRWEKYRIQYNWQPAFVVENPPNEFGISYFNGESARMPYPLDDSFLSYTHPVVKEIDFTYRSPKGWAYYYIIHFNELEMLNTYARLGSNTEPMKLEFDLQKPIEQTQIRLRNDKEVITLKQFFIEKI